MTTKSNEQETGERTLYVHDPALIGQTPWRLLGNGDIVAADGTVLLKTWNGYDNGLYAVKVVNAFADLERERDALTSLAKSLIRRIHAASHLGGDNPVTFEKCAEAVCREAGTALGETK